MVKENLHLAMPTANKRLFSVFLLHGKFAAADRTPNRVQ
jgi:hypothetical protein